MNALSPLFDLAIPFAEAVPWPALLIRPDATIGYANRLLSERSPAAVLAGRQLAETFPEYLDLYSTALVQPDGSSRDVFRQGGGGPIRERVTARPIAGLVLMIIEDRTRELELEAWAAQSAQTARLASLGFMLAGVCHEMSNPLAAVHSVAQFLRTEPGLPRQRLDRALESISSNVARVLDISRKLTDFSRAEGPNRASLRVDWAIEDAIAQFEQDSCAAAVTVEHVPDPTARVFGTVRELSQVFFNLLRNGAQAMGGRGNIEIATATLPCDTVIVTVRDRGPGIPPDILSRIFQPFFTTRSGNGGTGLGLAISEEIARELRGSISARNHEAGGAVFELRLPRHLDD